MLKIRLRRTGARKRPSYRLVVTEATAPRDGQFIDIIGFYDPLTDPATVRVDQEKARRWLSNGAQPTDRVAKLLAREGLIERAPIVGRKDGAKGASDAESPPATSA